MMRAMERDTFLRMLERAPGISGSGERFDVDDEHRVTLYTGRPSQAMQVNDVTAFALAEGFIEVTTRDEGTFFVGDESIHAISVNETKSKTGRAGFL
jgi:hypothetical protein